MNRQKNTNGYPRLLISVYDFAAFLFVEALFLVLYSGNERFTTGEIAIHASLTFLCTFTARIIGGVYRQVWRYGGIQCYIRLLAVDFAAFAVDFILECVIPVQRISFARLVAIVCADLLIALAMRMIYRYAYKCANNHTVHGRILSFLLRIFGGLSAVSHKHDGDDDRKKIRIAIIGAGRVGVTLAEELISNPRAEYVPMCYVDNKREKIGRIIHGIPVLAEEDGIDVRLKKYLVETVVFAIQDITPEQKKQLADRYLGAGFGVKVYDYPLMQNANGKRHLREFDIEELLFRKPIEMSNETTNAYYTGKVILVTGGGGSIGSELCRQIAKMAPAKLIILDICENGAYDIQQEIRRDHGSDIDLSVEIVSITNRRGLERVFTTYHPDIVINAAAHKHVPLMEHNCIEAIENNVFGTLNIVELCEKHHTGRFMMVSTDKAVNPTNVMGATKRMCEMIALSQARCGTVKYSCTRFGNVLGSAGSVIPLFKKQIASGGPITLTDRRIIRYFMTIPEAAQLVLQSGAMANNGELFVLDMGSPVKILDLAENMIKLSGVPGIEIIETGLRPGEKLYEELLVKTEELTKTENDLIFIEKETPVTKEHIAEKLSILREACATDDDEAARRALMTVVPTFRTPEEVNAKASSAKEMNG